MTCKNCAHTVSGKYCTNCGQSVTVGAITIAEVVKETWHNFTHTDTGYLQFVWLMLTRPGDTIRNYLAGQRKKYFNPFTFYIVTTSLLMLVNYQLWKKESEMIGNRDEIGRYQASVLNYILFCSLPFVAGVFQGIFSRSVKGYAEALVVVIFGYGMMNFLFLLINIFYYYFIELWNENYDVAGYLLLLCILSSFLRPLTLLKFVKLILLILVFYFITEILGPRLFLYEYGVPLEKLLSP